MKSAVVAIALAGAVAAFASQPASSAPIVLVPALAIQALGGDIVDAAWTRCWRDRWGRRVCQRCWRDRWGRVICR